MPIESNNNLRHSGLFITFEGGEGAGKTNQIKRLTKTLEEKGHQVIVTRNPGGHPISEDIRKLILDCEDNIGQQCEALLFIAANAQITNSIIIPNLQQGKIVICDRYTDSNIVYQGYAHGLSIQELRHINQYATNFLLPNLTILLDIDPIIGLARQTKRNRMEELGLEFHQKVHDGYLQEASLNPDRFHIIDATPAKEVVEKQVWEVVSNSLSKLR